MDTPMSAATTKPTRHTLAVTQSASSMGPT